MTRFGNNHALLTLRIYSVILVALILGYLLLPWELNTELGWHILLQLKLPVLITALLVGFCLCSASATLQVLLKNPLADPGILGIASGASAMAACYFVLISGVGLSLPVFLSPALLSIMLPLLCFIGALASGSLIFRLAHKIGFNPASVILAGIAVSTMLAAAVAWLYLLLPPTQLQSLTFWLMGSLNNANWVSLSVAVPIAIVSLGILYRHNPSLNYLFFGEQVAQLKGLDTRRFHRRQLVLIALMVGLSVSIAGSIAFLGLLVPHLLRQLHGYDNRLIVPLSGVTGSICLLVCAIVNQQLSTAPLPISMLTASIGAPIFIWLLLRGAGLQRLRSLG